MSTTFARCLNRFADCDAESSCTDQTVVPCLCLKQKERASGRGGGGKGEADIKISRNELSCKWRCRIRPPQKCFNRVGPIAAFLAAG